MNSQTHIMKQISLILFFFLLTSVIQAQPCNTSSFPYLSPLPDAELVSPHTTIIIGTSEEQTAFTDNKNNLITVTGSKSGVHSGRLLIADDKSTIIFKPANPFIPGERVTVTFAKGLAILKGDVSPSFSYSFVISTTDPSQEKPFNSIEREYQEAFGDSYIPKDTIGREQPWEIIMNTRTDPTPGHLFIAQFPYPEFSPGFLMILNNSGEAVYYKRVDQWSADFKPLPNGTLAYFDRSILMYTIMDRSFNIIDSVGCGNGYTTDMHELVLLPNGHYHLMSYDTQQIDMSQIVQGGQPEAQVTGLIIQELDTNKDVVFQWRSWDHVAITDANFNVDLTAQFIDYIHGNAIERDDDGNLLISSRHFDEITKINRQNGEIIWRMGGRQNMFTLTNSSRWFSHQHDIRKIANGHYTLFDNGNLLDPEYSRGMIYDIDENNMELTEVWGFDDNGNTFANAMGSCRRLANGNTVIGWGSSSNPAGVEVTSGDVKVFEFGIPPGVFNYRVFREQFTTGFFSTDSTSINFGYSPVKDTLYRTITIYNPQDTAISIDSTNRLGSGFFVTTSLPLTIPANGSAAITIAFSPRLKDSYADTLIIKVYRQFEMIGREIYLEGNSILSGTDNDMNIPLQFTLMQNYPNPFNPSTNISFTLPETADVKLTVYDALGTQTGVLVDDRLAKGSHSITFNSADLPSGVYFYRLQAGSFNAVRKMLLLK